MNCRLTPFRKLWHRLSTALHALAGGFRWLSRGVLGPFRHTTRAWRGREGTAKVLAVTEEQGMRVEWVQYSHSLRMYHAERMWQVFAREAADQVTEGAEGV